MLSTQHVRFGKGPSEKDPLTGTSSAAYFTARPVLRGPWRSNAPGLPDEIFFSIITRQAIRRGSFDSVKELTAAIQRFINAWNDRCEPFLWTKTAQEIVDKATPKHRKTTSVTLH